MQNLIYADLATGEMKVFEDFSLNMKVYHSAVGALKIEKDIIFILLSPMFSKLEAVKMERNIYMLLVPDSMSCYTPQSLCFFSVKVNDKPLLSYVSKTIVFSFLFDYKENKKISDSAILPGYKGKNVIIEKSSSDYQLLLYTATENLEHKELVASFPVGERYTGISIAVSPSGKYLAFCYCNQIVVIDFHKDKIFYILAAVEDDIPDQLTITDDGILAYRQRSLYGITFMFICKITDPYLEAICTKSPEHLYSYFFYKKLIIWEGSLRKRIHLHVLPLDMDILNFSKAAWSTNNYAIIPDAVYNEPYESEILHRDTVISNLLNKDYFKSEERPIYHFLLDSQKYNKVGVRLPETLVAVANWQEFVLKDFLKADVSL